MISLTTAERATARDLHVFAGLGLALGLVAYCGLRPWNLVDHFFVAAPAGRDFVNFWLGGRLALDGNLALLTDFEGYNALIKGLFNSSTPPFVYSYPPHMVMFTIPLGALPFKVALVLWITMNLGAMYWVARQLGASRLAAVAAGLSPAALMMIGFGHFGGLIVAAIYLGLVEARTRPWLAGFGLALLSVKPQLAIVLGLLMVGAGMWRAVLIGIVVAGAMIGASALLLGLNSWHGFIQWTVPFHANLLIHYDPRNFPTAISLYTALRNAGAPALPANVAQYCVALAGLTLAIRALRMYATDARTMTLAVLALLLAQPYANIYDLAILAPALSAAIFSSSLDDERSLPPSMLMLALWLAPLVASATAVGLPAVQLILITSIAVIAAPVARDISAWTHRQLQFPD